MSIHEVERTITGPDMCPDASVGTNPYLQDRQDIDAADTVVARRPYDIRTDAEKYPLLHSMGLLGSSIDSDREETAIASDEAIEKILADPNRKKIVSFLIDVALELGEDPTVRPAYFIASVPEHDVAWSIFTRRTDLTIRRKPAIPEPRQAAKLDTATSL